MNQWQKAELEIARLIGGCIVEDLVLQYKDIDVVTDLYSYSVKWQSLVAKYDSVLFETHLVDTTNNTTTKGSFPKCEADRYAIKWPDANNKTVWAIFDTTLLKEFIDDGEWKKQYTNSTTSNMNKKDGRTYNSTVMVCVPPSKLINCNAFLTGINTNQYKD